MPPRPLPFPSVVFSPLCSVLPFSSLLVLPRLFIHFISIHTSSLLLSSSPHNPHLSFALNQIEHIKSGRHSRQCLLWLPAVFSLVVLHSPIKCHLYHLISYGPYNTDETERNPGADVDSKERYGRWSVERAPAMDWGRVDSQAGKKRKARKEQEKGWETERQREREKSRLLGHSEMKVEIRRSMNKNHIESARTAE